MSHDNAAHTLAEQPLGTWDTTSHEDFYRYYETQSLSTATMERFSAITDVLLRLFGDAARERPLDVLDIGCNAGTQAKFWLDRGHRYRGIDINEPLVALARERARREGLDARFDVGTATALPLDDASVDVCVMPELLEHVQDWQGCVDEAVRVLRPGGLIYINTSNRLCPLQQEFNLPLYSWYPAPLKRYFVRRSLTDWPELTHHATYPAVNWFTFFGLRDYLKRRGCVCLDRFDMMETAQRGALARAAVGLLRNVGPLRLLGHVLTPYTVLVARKAA